MAGFITTDGRGNFLLDGKPHFLHGATYFGRRPGTCGADWTGEHFDFNLAHLDADLEQMRGMGLNMLGLFVLARPFFDGLRPVQERFDRLHIVLDGIRRADMHAVVFEFARYEQDAWCAARGVEPGGELWHPAVHPEAERAQVEATRAFRKPFADRPEIAGWATDIGRFFAYGFTVPPVRKAWAAWLAERFGGDLARARELLDLAPEEDAWEAVRMPTEMEPYFNEDNPRSFEFALMQQVLCRRAARRITDAVRPAAPRHLIVESMEGCCFSGGHLTAIVPEMVAADALWVECYHWEGLRSYHYGGGPPRWMKEPVADKPSVEIINAAGYVQMLTRWAERSGKGLIICHGVDMGEKKRGVRSEDDQAVLLGRYSQIAHASGAHGVNYWCWSDDEQSRTFTRALGVEYSTETPADKKKYSQSGETMGLVRYDGSERPVAERVRVFAERALGRARVLTPPEVLVLFPCPVFQSTFRYRANATGFGIFTSLARQGILAHCLMTSAGERVIGPDDLRPYRLVIVGAAEYERDHPEVPDLLLGYVEAGGTLLLPLAETGRLRDPYLKWRPSRALERLAGCEGQGERRPCEQIEDLGSDDAALAARLPAGWELHTDTAPTFTHVSPAPGARVLVRAGKEPLLYTHAVGRGQVYAFTWNMDVFLYRGAQVDYPGDDWDWLWDEPARTSGVTRDEANPIAQIVRDMTD